MKYNYYYVIPLGLTLSAGTAVPEKSTDAAPVSWLLICSLLTCEAVLLYELAVCALTTGEARWAGMERGSGSQSSISGFVKDLEHDLGKGTLPLFACISFPVYIGCTLLRHSLLCLVSSSPRLLRVVAPGSDGE